MPIDTGTAVIVGAVLIFYLRLIILQRERAKRVRQPNPSDGKGNKKSKARRAEAQRQFSILSQNPRDWAIAAAGVLAILAGILLYRQVLPGTALQAYWWLPLALGIVAFSWAFR
jgi:hypothetical protein